MGNNHSVRMQVMCALFTAVCAVFSQLTIPIQPVPITLGSFAALMAGGFLVFSMMRAGVSVIAGPSGGFIVGFAVMAFIVGLVGEKLGFTFKNMLLGTVLGTAACYTMGLAWFMFLTGNGLWASMLLCMFPFLPGDITKIVLASYLISRYRKRLIGTN